MGPIASFISELAPMASVPCTDFAVGQVFMLTFVTASLTLGSHYTDTFVTKNVMHTRSYHMSVIGALVSWGVVATHAAAPYTPAYLMTMLGGVLIQSAHLFMFTVRHRRYLATSNPNSQKEA